MTVEDARDELVAAIDAAVAAAVAVYEYPVRVGYQTRLPASVTVESVTPTTSSNTDMYEATLRAEFDAGADLSAAYVWADDVLEDVEAALPVNWEAVRSWFEEFDSEEAATITYSAVVYGHPPLIVPDPIGDNLLIVAGSSLLINATDAVDIN